MISLTLFFAPFTYPTAVHDAGTIVNPGSLDGQIIGGTAQGIGTALFEGDTVRSKSEVLEARDTFLADLSHLAWCRAR